VVVAAGGDGTLNEVVQGVAGTRSAVGYLPLGTVNIWAREVGIPMNLEAAARSLVAAQIKQVDLGRANGRYFLLMAGMGFDAEVVSRARRLESLKRRFGVLPYAAAAVSTMPRYRGMSLELTYDGIYRTVRALMLVVGNTRLYGGHWYFTPRAVANDGWLDLAIVKGSGPVAMLRRSLPMLVSRRVSRESETVRVRELSVRSREPVPYQVDGELAGDSPVDFSIAPGALRVLVPRGQDTGLIR
jgi:YegS/Rv2252/BmrU family lipid kinase